MKMNHLVLKLITIGTLSLWSLGNDLVYPWVTNNAQFRGTVVVNNLNDTAATVTLKATRPNGETETATRTIEPFSQLVESSASLFASLGDGSGYLVELSSATDNLTGGFVVTGTFSASGSSPAQANVVSPDSASNIILYNYLPIPTDGGNSAPVVVNMGSTDADITFHGYQNGEKVGVFVVRVPSHHPFAQVTSTMFPDTTGDIYVVAESTQPLLGMAFIFNAETEPSMANSVAISAVPDPDDGGGSQTVSFSEVIQPIFSISCALSGCHTGSSPAQGLNLSAGMAYAEIVNVSAAQSSLDLVEPGDAENSYLYRKVDPTLSISGAPMPRNMAPLSSSQLTAIRTWINEGAANN